MSSDAVHVSLGQTLHLADVAMPIDVGRCTRAPHRLNLSPDTHPQPQATLHPDCDPHPHTTLHLDPHPNPHSDPDPNAKPLTHC
eukprot:3158513-Prymnesium_polylepis.2